MGIKYLGAASSKKWLLAMDGGARPAPSQKRPFPPDGELVELLWRNGAVVARSQAQGHNYHQREVVRRGPSGGNTGASGVTEDAAWLPDANALGGDTYAQLWRDVARLEGWVDADTATSAFWPPPPATSGGAGSSRTTGGEVGSSFCGSNNLVTAALLRTGASTSGWTESGALLRRSRDEVDGRGEDADFDETRRPASKRRTRSTQVHNMSERRRRDRFNEKMRALQELVPHCNKTDKASILDEAIEYLKSLQMQVQIMWMTTGMAPMMIPGGHQELMGTGLNSSSMPPAAHVPSQMQRVAPFMNNPLPNQMPGVSSAATGAQNEASQVQKNQVGGPRNPFFHPDDAPAATAEVPSLFGCGSQMAHQNYFQDLLANTAAPPFGAEQPSSFDGTGTT